MASCASVLDFAAKPAGWGVFNAKPAPPVTGTSLHAAVLMVGPPLTATWRMRKDLTSQLVIGAPLIIYTEDDAVILPPDDKHGVAFYQDPPDQPGLHRDLFRQWGKDMLSALMDKDYVLTPKLAALASSKYDSEPEES